MKRPRPRPRRVATTLAGALLALAPTAGVALAAFQNSTRLTASVAAAQEFPPLVELVPHIAGAAYGGQTLTVVPGVWSRTVPGATRTYRWYRCTATSGCGGTPVGTGTSYAVPTSDDAPLGTPSSVAFAVQETVANAATSASALSVPTAPQTRGGFLGAYLGTGGLELAVVASTPTTMPAIDGGVPRVGTATGVGTGSWSDSTTSVIGAILNVLAGLLSLNGPVSYDYQWLRCGPVGNTDSATVGAAGCATIGGATAASYAPTAADVGHRLRVRVTRTSPRPLVNAGLASLLGLTIATNDRAVATVLTQASSPVTTP